MGCEIEFGGIRGYRPPAPAAYHKHPTRAFTEEGCDGAPSFTIHPVTLRTVRKSFA